MKRSKLRTLPRSWDGGKTAIYVVVHARYQVERGRNPSEAYEGERNPRKALLIAIAALEASSWGLGSGPNIAAIIDQMCWIARHLNRTASTMLNGVLVVARPDSSPQSLLDYQRGERRRQKDALRRQELRRFMMS